MVTGPRTPASVKLSVATWPAWPWTFFSRSAPEGRCAVTRYQWSACASTDSGALSSSSSFSPSKIWTRAPSGLRTSIMVRPSDCGRYSRAMPSSAGSTGGGVSARATGFGGAGFASRAGPEQAAQSRVAASRPGRFMQSL